MCSVQSCCSECFAVWLRIMDTLSKAHQTPRPISPALSATHHEYQMVQQSNKCLSATKSQLKMQSIDTLLTLSQLRWSGHLVHMSDDRLPKQLFYSELSEGHRLRGR